MTTVRVRGDQLQLDPRSGRHLSEVHGYLDVVVAGPGPPPFED